MYFTGSRDPYQISGTGAGFVLAWRGSPTITAGYGDADKELIQVESERMMLAIPKYVHLNMDKRTISSPFCIA